MGLLLQERERFWCRIKKLNFSNKDCKETTPDAYAQKA